MRLTEDTLKQLSDPNLTADERALLRCRLAADLIHRGQYETARDALGDLWQGVGERPELTGLEPQTVAEVLLQCGVLSGWLGSVRQIPGTQERAKDLLTDAQRRFQSQGRTVKVAEVYYELGKCYFRLGAYEDSRVILDEALDLLGDSDHELKAKVLIRRTLIEIWTGRYHDALAILERAREFFEASGDALKGRWHAQTALVLRRLGTAERRSDYADRAIVEFTAAIYHFEQAGHERYCAYNLNNLAMLLYTLGRYEDAHENLDRATHLFKQLGGDGLLAQVNETRARVLVAEGRYGGADGVIAEVIKTFKQGGENALLADALTIQGVVWARTELHEQSINILRHALTIAQDSGASSNAAHAALTLIEEHGQARLTDYDLYHTYRLADDLLKDTQDAEDIARLRACAGIVTKRLSGAQVGEKNFSLRKAILAYEAKCIEQALRAAQGKVTRAAKMLGIGYQSLAEILKGRQKKLRHLRTPPLSRKKWAVRATRQTDLRTAGKGVRPAAILHVEDSQPVANAVRDILEMEGLSVVTCDDGAKALRKLADKEHYDLLLFDNVLPHASGIELISRARQLPHRRRTPIIMLSASDVETEAWRAGADAFLRKPDDIERLPEMVMRLLSKGL
jgi:CheY-like chemotaxis protein/tetratricopeptide (TPR) repeat protein